MIFVLTSIKFTYAKYFQLHIHNIPLLENGMETLQVDLIPATQLSKRRINKTPFKMIRTTDGLTILNTV